MLHTGAESNLEALSASPRGWLVCLVHAIPIKPRGCVHKSMDLTWCEGLISRACRALKASLTPSHTADWQATRGSQLAAWQVVA